MIEIVPLLICLDSILSSTSLRQLRHVVFAMLCIPNRATMLGLSRWTERGGSYRTLQRFYQSPVNWAMLHWTLIRTHLLTSGSPYLLAGDEVVVSKAGKETHGAGCFYSGLAQRVIPGVSFLTISLIDVTERRSYPLQIEQLLPQSPTKATPSDEPKRKPGRPSGSKNHVKADARLTPELTALQRLLNTIRVLIKVKLIVLDGKFGTYPATWAVRQCEMDIISKMRHDAALYLPYAGEKPARGPTPRYGHKLNYAHLPTHCWVSTHTEGDYRLDTYHIQAYHKGYPELLNIVVVVKTHFTNGKHGHVVLFSTALDLTAWQIVDYYSLRFQIEFNFRDAKQHWGLEDFMNVSQQAVTNAVNLSFFMVNLSHVMLRSCAEDGLSVLDLKAQFRAQRYLSETIKMLPDPPDEHLVSHIWRQLTRFGGIRTRQCDHLAA